MGFFDRFRNDPKDDFLPHEALLYLLFLAMTADGQIGEDETRILKSILRRVDLFDGMDDAALAPLQKRYRQLRSGGDRKLVLKRFTSRMDPALAAPAYALVLEILFAKGSISTTEAEFAEKVRKALRLQEGASREIYKALRQGLVLDEMDGPTMNFAPGNTKKRHQ